MSLEVNKIFVGEFDLVLGQFNFGEPMADSVLSMSRFYLEYAWCAYALGSKQTLPGHYRSFRVSFEREAGGLRIEAFESDFRVFASERIEADAYFSAVSEVFAESLSKLLSLRPDMEALLLKTDFLGYGPTADVL